MSSLREQIIQALRERPQGLRRAELRRAAGAHSKEDTREFGYALRGMLQQGDVVKQGRGRLALPDTSKNVTGNVTVHARGFGFLTPDAGGEDVFIPPAKLGNAFAGDRVRVQIVEQTDKGPVGMVTDILQRGHTRLTGEYVNSGPTPVIRPMRRDYPDEVELIFPRRLPMEDYPVDGDWIVAEILFPDTSRQALRGKYLSTLNQGASLTEDMDAIVAEYALPEPYSDAEQAAAAAMTPRRIAREDWSHLTTVTIDPVDAKDFDDAISLEMTDNPDIVRAGVHIADVAAYIIPDSDWDRQARRRGFTAYLPGRTLPMLPKPLAADLCSLKEGAPRPAHSVFLDIDRQSGEILSTRRARALIHVSKRLNFSEVEAFLAGRKNPGWGDDVAAAVKELGRLSHLLRQIRQRKEAFLDLATTEVRVLYSDDPPAVTGFQESRPNPAHQLVEEFMLAANVAVAKELIREKIPGLFRVHGTPKSKDVDDFRAWVRSALRLKAGKLDSRGSVNAFLHEITDHPAAQIIFNGFLRTLPRAVYAAACSEHFGLGKDQYTHFTSPIRRYADLTVHQQLWRKDLGEELLSQEECEARAKEVTAIEAINDEAYFAALDRVKIRYLNQRRGAGEKVVFQAVISRATPDGLALFIPELGLMGFAPKTLLGEDDFIYAAKTCSLRARHADRVYHCGDIISVRPHKADVARGELVLRPA
ncbi:MAG: ribonuclease R [Lentisphaeria bacterium]|nr:ribonuclease R [Lentisphaeria bacterium]